MIDALPRPLRIRHGLASLLLAAFLGAAETPASTMPAARDTPSWLVKHQAQREDPARSSARVVFIGDSLTENWLAEGRATWATHFAPLPAVHRGIGGDRCEQVLWRVRNGALDGCRAEVVVLLVGTNSLALAKDRLMPSEYVAAGVAAVLAAVRAVQPQARVLLVGLPPRHPSRGAAWPAAVIATNRLLAPQADGAQVRWYDPGPVLSNATGQDPACYRADELHLSALGYERLGAALAHELAAMGVPAATAASASHSDNRTAAP